MLDDHLIKLFREGKISEDDTVDHAQSPSEIREKIDAFRAGGPSGPGGLAPPEDDVRAPQSPK